MSGDRICITYELTLGPGEDADRKARGVALEQTVELPDGCYPDHVADEVVGVVEDVSADGDAARAVISYEPGIVAGSMLGLLNLVYGNVSMQDGVRVVGLDLPPPAVQGLPGPAFGIAGVRAQCEATGRPLICAAAKPIGLSSEELAWRCGQFAEAGVDLIKDDHSLGDQEWAPFSERMSECLEAVERVNQRTGGHTTYLPNLLPGRHSLDVQLSVVRELGCRGVVLSPWLVGFDALRRLAEAADLMVFAHPTASGGLGSARHGIAPELLYGTLCRVAGADAVIYPNAGGRFPITEDACARINDRLREPKDGFRRSFPVAGGGIDAERIGYWTDRYGDDTIFLLGSSLYSQSDVAAATRRVVEAVRSEK